MSIKFKLTIPKPNLRWYRDSKKELLAVVEKHNKESWAKEADPVSGKKWAPRKKPTGTHPILKKTGKMFSSTNFMAGDRIMDFKARVNVKYGGFHQKGTSKMVRRRWLGVGSTIDDKMMPVVKKHLFKGLVTFET